MNDTSDVKIELPFRMQRLRISFEHVSFMITVFTAISIFWAFWIFENRLWNRISYNIGKWEYVDPLYGDLQQYPKGSYMQFMVSDLIVMFLLLLVYTVAAIFLITILHEKGTTTRKSYITLTSISIIVLLITWWIDQSFWNSPKNWFRLELQSLDNAYWKIGGIPLPFASNKEAFIKNLLRLNVLIALFAVGYDLFIDGKAILQYRKELQEKTIKQEKKPLTFNRFLKLATFYSIMLLFLIYTLYPIYYTFMVSISNDVDLRNQTLASEPIKNFIINYSSVIFVRRAEDASFQTAFFYFLMLGVGTAIGGLSISLPAAYIVSRYRFKGRKPVEFLILATQMFPGIILLLPQYLIWKELHLLDTDNRRLFGTLLAYFAGSIAYTVWMMKGYFETIPRDLEEAAYVDGSTEFATFLRISLPLAAPGMAAVGIFTFLGAWNEFALAQIFIGENKPQSPLPLLLYNYSNSQDNTPYYQLLAAYSVLAALPIIIIFLSLQRLIARGVTAGGVK